MKVIKVGIPSFLIRWSSSFIYLGLSKWPLSFTSIIDLSLLNTWIGE